MKAKKLLISIVIVSLLVSMAIPMAAAKKPPRPPPDDPPADPAIAYRVQQGKPYKLMVMNADGSNQASIYSERYLGNPTWAPDGSAIAILHGTSPQDLMRIDVTIVDGVPQGSNPVDLVQDVSLCEPAWSPAGDVIAFKQNLEDGSKVIQTVPATGGAVETIYTAPEGYGIGDIAWGNDASQLAFTTGNNGLYYLMALDISDYSTTILYGPTTEGLLGHMDWARTSDTFVGSRNDGIYILDITQPNPTPQLLIAGQYKMPTWSPDDTQIALLKWDKNNWLNLMVYDLATGEMEKLAKGFAPHWCRA